MEQTPEVLECFDVVTVTCHFNRTREQFLYATFMWLAEGDEYPMVNMTEWHGEVNSIYQNRVQGWSTNLESEGWSAVDVSLSVSMCWGGILTCLVIDTNGRELWDMIALTFPGE